MFDLIKVNYFCSRWTVSGRHKNAFLCPWQDTVQTLKEKKKNHSSEKEIFHKFKFGSKLSTVPTLFDLPLAYHPINFFYPPLGKQMNFMSLRLEAIISFFWSRRNILRLKQNIKTDQDETKRKKISNHHKKKENPKNIEEIH